MADDAIALLNYVGWTEARDLHVVGVSLGGMIAQGTSLQHLHTLGPPRNADHEAQKLPTRSLSASSRLHWPSQLPVVASGRICLQ